LAVGQKARRPRSELVAIEVEDLPECPDGLRVNIRPIRRARGQQVAILRGVRICPVEAVQTWLTAALISSGPVFRSVTKGGLISEAALMPDSVAVVVKKYAERVGLDPAGYSGHSLRSGVLTSAAETGLASGSSPRSAATNSLDTRLRAAG
jgi:hypothetical protein